MVRIFDEKTDRETAILVYGVFLALMGSLPPILHPLFEILEVFREELVRVYQEYEESFDGSIILRNVRSFHLCLEELARTATQVEIWDFPKTSTVDVSTMRPHPLQDTGGGEEEDTVRYYEYVARGTIQSDRPETPVQTFNGGETIRTPLEKRKAGNPLGLPAAKIRLYTEKRRA